MKEILKLRLGYLRSLYLFSYFIAFFFEDFNEYFHQCEPPFLFMYISGLKPDECLLMMDGRSDVVAYEFCYFINILISVKIVF